jgi:hypothetical protein
VRIYPKQIPNMSRDILKALMDNGDVEVLPAKVEEARKDVGAVLSEFLRMERQLDDLAKDVLASRGWSSSHYGEARRVAAEARKVPQGDEAVEYVVNQMLEALMSSANFEEVFAEDHVMRKRIVGIIREHMKLDEEIESEARRRLKNLEEGSRDWDIAYRKTVEEIRRLKGLS